MENYTFNPVETREALIEALRQIRQKQGFDKAVLGVSGGKDSTVAAALLCRAYGPENVYGIMLPDGVQKDISDSQQVFEALGMEKHTVNFQEVHRSMMTAIDEGTGLAYHREADINVSPRIRMTILRYVAQSLNGRLVGTGNLSERYVGYCTKDGDTSCDFGLLGSLTTVEVVQVGLSMEELPKSLVVKAPSDGLSGHTDEERLGVTYQQIHDVIRHGGSGDAGADARIARLHATSAHKRQMPPILLES